MTTATAPVSIALIKRIVGAHFGMTPDALLDHHRGQSATPRQIAMYLAAALTRQSYPQIGRCFLRDHTTVMYARRQIEARMVEDCHLDDTVRRLRAEILAAANPPSSSERLAVRLVLDTAAVFRTAGLDLAAKDPAGTIALIAPVATALGVALPKEIVGCG